MILQFLWNVIVVLLFPFVFCMDIIMMGLEAFTALRSPVSDCIALATTVASSAAALVYVVGLAAAEDVASQIHDACVAPSEPFMHVQIVVELNIWSLIACLCRLSYTYMSVAAMLLCRLCALFSIPLLAFPSFTGSVLGLALLRTLFAHSGDGEDSP